MKVGDLVRLKQQGGVGIILEKKDVWSNIAMGKAVKQLVRWIEPPNIGNQDKENLYYQVYLELIETSVKK
jgi:hypothetical protein|tara:strand:- start:240 stop:449 length:210 start_codon:yes stop_codon:yes gene_type:complete